jgi:hypothetical protein
VSPLRKQLGKNLPNKKLELGLEGWIGVYHMVGSRTSKIKEKAFETFQNSIIKKKN